MKDKKVIGGIFLLLLTFALFLVFFIFKDDYNRNLYRIAFTLLFEIMSVFMIINIFYSKRKINLKSKIIFIFVNTLLITFGLFFLYGLPYVTGKSNIMENWPLIGNFPFMSALFTTVLAVTISIFIVYNYVWVVYVRHIAIRKHIIYIDLFYLIFLASLFMINKMELLESEIFHLMYLAAAGSLFIVFSLYIYDLKLKTKIKFIYNTLLILFLATEFGFIYFSETIFTIKQAQPAYHTGLLIMIALNVLTGLSGYAFIQKLLLKKFILPNVAMGIGITGLIYFNYFHTDISRYMFHFISTSTFESLLIAGSFIIFSKKNYDVYKRLLFVFILLLLSGAALYFQLNGSNLIKADIFSFQILVAMVCAACFNLSYVFVVLTIMNNQIQTEAKKIKAGKKKKSTPIPKGNIKPPFEAYRGTGKFIFVSYSHRDMKEIFIILKRLFDKGYKIWYDEGIEPGDEWPETIGKAIDGCHKFIVFMSRPAARSRNVRNEINFAFNKKKDMTVVMLEKTSLTHGLDLQIGTVQSINKFDLNDKEFYQKIDGVLK